MFIKPLAWCFAHIKLLINVSCYYCLWLSSPLTPTHAMSDKAVTSSISEVEFYCKESPRFQMGISFLLREAEMLKRDWNFQ